MRDSLVAATEALVAVERSLSNGALSRRHSGATAPTSAGQTVGCVGADTKNLSLVTAIGSDVDLPPAEEVNVAWLTALKHQRTAVRSPGKL